MNRNPRKFISYIEGTAWCKANPSHQAICQKIGQHWYVVRIRDTFILCGDGQWRDCEPCPVA